MEAESNSPASKRKTVGYALPSADDDDAKLRSCWADPASIDESTCRGRDETDRRPTPLRVSVRSTFLWSTLNALTMLGKEGRSVFFGATNLSFLLQHLSSRRTFTQVATTSDVKDHLLPRGFRPTHPIPDAHDEVIFAGRYIEPFGGTPPPPFMGTTESFNSGGGGH